MPPEKGHHSYFLIVFFVLLAAIFVTVGFFYYQSYANRLNRLKVDEARTPQETLNFLENKAQTKFAQITKREPSNVEALPADIVALLSKDGDTTVSAVTFDNSLEGYEILLNYSGQDFESIQQHFINTARVDYQLVEGYRDLSNSTALMIFENSVYLLKIILSHDNEVSDNIPVIMVLEKR